MPTQILPNCNKKKERIPKDKEETQFPKNIKNEVAIKVLNSPTRFVAIPIINGRIIFGIA